MSDTETNLLENTLVGLAGIEQEVDQAERDADIFRIKKTHPIYIKRRQLLLDVPKFWYIVIAQNEDFIDYIGPEDLKFLEFVKDIYVEYDVATNDEATNPRDFSITFQFEAPHGEIAAQSVTKKFKTVMDEDNHEERLISTVASVEWPVELASITPHLIADKTSAEGKKKYRLGMRSFFAWFKWTGLKPGKEFRNGEELTRLIVEELFPYAVKYYTEAVPGLNEDSEDESSEELDLSGEEEEEENATKKRKL
ncbi:hypothetical protein BABINDRAFT_166750 [Babjeviella inositovora NRRL Y-12698]|uniref:Vacuolar protein sorting-associated protein 75 n=1 Tax=Babjeviella inositovora NRRL Y-12698 TaxID=984486 RepID=A0A1E3QS03_9ASCO|nr:uncharacterized protein BABINDRAFT_166750 [Babjeviella inositovora NRRL Y-12698]ODQ80418.1 hypothetical protein BABINDRAFT_166750 [Babjeviella inositovora NRRL Y-12698]